MNSRVFGVLLAGWLLVGCGDDESTPRPETTQDTDRRSRASPPASCVSDIGPLTTLDTPRQTLPWSLDPSSVAAQDAGTGDPPDADAGGTGNPPDADAGGGGGTGDPPDADAGGDGSAAISGCQKTIQRGLGTSITCEGTAAVEAGEGGPTLTFADGSRLIWDSRKIQTRVALEFELDATRVWVSYSESKIVVCPYCGTYGAQAITVREREDGKPLVVAQQGHRLDALAGSALVLQLFGVDTVARPRCSYFVTAPCYTYDRTEFDHALLTDPEQFIPNATLTRVSSENGDYDVLWAHSEQTNFQSDPPSCSDSPLDASNTGFLAIRRN